MLLASLEVFGGAQEVVLNVGNPFSPVSDSETWLCFNQLLAKYQICIKEDDLESTSGLTINGRELSMNCQNTYTVGNEKILLLNHPENGRSCQAAAECTSTITTSKFIL